MASISSILIVDDEEHVLAAMGEYFAALGYDVACARDADAARVLLERTKYRVVITDLRLSGSDRYEGLQILEYVRARVPGAASVVLTAYGFADNEERARRAGASAFLQKPQSLDDLSRIVKGLIDDAVTFA
jgi:two-component system C4-dicarboxylate transport response regulator DctD